MKIRTLFTLSALAALCLNDPLRAADAPESAVPPAVQSTANTAPNTPTSMPQGFTSLTARRGEPQPLLRPEELKPIDADGKFRFRLNQLAQVGGNTTPFQFSPILTGNATTNTTLLDWLEMVKLSLGSRSGAITDAASLLFRVYSDDNNTLVLAPSLLNAPRGSGGFVPGGTRGATSGIKTIVVNVGDLRKGKAANYKITLGSFPADANLNLRGTAAEYPISADIGLIYPPFVFDGGNALDFVAEVRKIYGVDWGILELPPEAADVRVPKMRVGGSAPGGGTNVWQVINLYNSLSEDNSALGKWKWGGNLYNPTAINLALPMNYTSAPAMKVKALSVAKVDAKNLRAFSTGLESALKAARQLSGTTPLTGQLSLQDDTKMLIVAGTPDYIDFVESYIEAYTKANEAARP